MLLLRLGLTLSRRNPLECLAIWCKPSFGFDVGCFHFLELHQLACELCFSRLLQQDLVAPFFFFSFFMGLLTFSNHPVTCAAPHALVRDTSTSPDEI